MNLEKTNAIFFDKTGVNELKKKVVCFFFVFVYSISFENTSFITQERYELYAPLCQTRRIPIKANTAVNIRKSYNCFTKDFINFSPQERCQFYAPLRQTRRIPIKANSTMYYSITSLWLWLFYSLILFCLPKLNLNIGMPSVFIFFCNYLSPDFYYSLIIVNITILDVGA